MGAPGADLGEFILGIHALEGARACLGSPRRRWLTDVFQLLSEFLLDMTSWESLVALVTDEAAVDPGPIAHK